MMETTKPLSLSTDGYDFDVTVGPHTGKYGAVFTLMEARTQINGRGYVFSNLQKPEKFSETRFWEFMNDPGCRDRRSLTQSVSSQLRWDAREGIGV